MRVCVPIARPVFDDGDLDGGLNYFLASDAMKVKLSLLAVFCFIRCIERCRPSHSLPAYAWPMRGHRSSSPRPPLSRWSCRSPRRWNRSDVLHGLLLLASSSLSDELFADTEPPISIPTSKIPPPPPISMPVWSLAAQRTSTLNSQATGNASAAAAAAPPPPSTSSPRTSMNIVTFATSVSVAPPKLWIVSLYHGTLTKDSFCHAGCGVMQLLTPSHKGLVDALGKHSGYDTAAPASGSVSSDVTPYNKQEECATRGFSPVDCRGWTRRGNLVGPADLLPGCASYVFLKHLGKQMDAGDHVAILCKVVATGRWDDDRQTVVDVDMDLPLSPAMDHTSVLYTGQLRDEGLL
jgi:flavin reductase (DIM6/NTAB) family NADH-FMN oxidoreductase RutF